MRYRMRQRPWHLAGDDLRIRDEAGGNRFDVDCGTFTIGEDDVPILAHTVAVDQAAGRNHSEAASDTVAGGLPAVVSAALQR